MDAVFFGFEIAITVICLSFAVWLGIYLGIDAWEHFIKYIDKRFMNRRVAYKIREDDTWI